MYFYFFQKHKQKHHLVNFGKITFTKLESEVEAEVQAENYLAFEYNYRSIFYHNKKLINYLDVINIKVLFLIKLQLRSEKMKIKMKVGG